MSSSLYNCLCFMRILITLTPETGYIHPDEFFQGPEIIYGDLFGLKTHKTWEFSSLKPIRSIVFPFFITAFPAWILNVPVIKSFIFGTALYPYLLLVLPRILMCCISFIIDILIYKTCVTLNQNPDNNLIIYASSYVTLTYLTRTLSNSLETLFFAFLIFLTFTLLKTKGSSNGSLLIYFKKQRYKIYFIMGIIVAVGVFNRPTFIVYSFLPVGMALFCCNRNNFKLFLTSFLLGGFSTTFCFSCLDTMYYKKVHYSNIDINALINNFVITPVNFILYNANTMNLSIHGLHPRYLHLLVNVPLLFSVCGLHVIVKTVRYFRLVLRNPYNAFDINNNLFLLLFLFPLGLLSLVPHQEPRFIVPLLFPLTLMQFKFLKNKFCFGLWCISNVLCLLFYGIYHQGGVCLSTSFLHVSIQKYNHSAIIYHKTYMPPRFLLGISENNVLVHDFAGVSEKTFELSITHITQKNLTNIFFVVPFERLHSFKKLSSLLKEFKLHSINSLFPHLSTETFPDLEEIKTLFFSDKPFIQKIRKIRNMFSIHILMYEHR